jgi:ABC-type nitrate/sulfonate/bicarbonate transport system substrate-binding protein
MQPICNPGFIALLISLVVSWPRAGESQVKKAEMVRVSMASFGAIYYPHLVAKELGYYADEGINPEIILMSGSIATPALVTGDIQFSTSSGSALAAILRGFDLRVIYVTVDRPYYSIFSNKKELRTAPDLRGKRIGIPGRGDSHHIAASLWLKKYGVDPEREVHWISTGPTTATRIAALVSGQVDAITSPPSGTYTLKTEYPSVYEIADLGREVKMLYTGLAIAKNLLEGHSEMVRRFLRATVKGREFYKHFKDETLRLTKKYDANSEGSRKADYEITLQAMTKDGTEDLETQKSDIDIGLRNLGMRASVPPERVFDFRLIGEVYKELNATNWKPASPGKVAQ